MKENKHHSTLVIVAIWASAVGILIAGIATTVYRNSYELYGPPEFGGERMLLSDATAWQFVGLLMLGFGALSFLAACITGSISHDLRASQPADPA